MDHLSCIAGMHRKAASVGHDECVCHIRETLMVIVCIMTGTAGAHGRVKERDPVDACAITV
jgi:hypothetical protein